MTSRGGGVRGPLAETSDKNSLWDARVTSPGHDDAGGEGGVHFQGLLGNFACASKILGRIYWVAIIIIRPSNEI